MKTCSRCGESKPATTEYYVKDKRLKCGLRAICKECNRRYRKENKHKMKRYYEENKKTILEQKKRYHEENKEEIMEYKKKRYEKNKDKHLDWQKEYYQKNKQKVRKYKTENADRIREVGKARRKRKKEHIARVQREYTYRRRREDTEFRLLDVCRKRLYKAVKNNRKSAKTIELIGCSTEHLKHHLEKQFKEGMSWENYGEWHIDHIMPCASFDFSKPEHQKECFNYMNLQPLWAEENIRKSDKVADHY
ncbi:MAG: hypothetical protein L0J35_04160 [Tetragenococcus halophilus]|nr:hypothetical protein [Tetragenococcus halophilus]